MNPGSLQPTLWRTCRILASRTRLRLLAELAHKQPRSVSELAGALALSQPLSSLSLRALESRGLLKVKRIRRRVEYRIATTAAAGELAGLIAALQAGLSGETAFQVLVFKLATAFTHPSRVQIYCSLKVSEKSQTQLQAELRISRPALCRHLQKLLTRGFVTRDDAGIYSTLKHHHALGRVLAELAAGQLPRSR